MWYIPCLAVINAHVGHTRYRLFTNISWNWLQPTCLQCYLPELFLEVGFYCWCHFITDIIVYTYAVWYELFEKQRKYYTLFRVLRVCFSIYKHSSGQFPIKQLLSKVFSIGWTYPLYCVQTLTGNSWIHYTTEYKTVSKCITYFAMHWSMWFIL